MVPWIRCPISVQMLRISLDGELRRERRLQGIERIGCRRVPGAGGDRISLGWIPLWFKRCPVCGKHLRVRPDFTIIF